MKHRKLSAVNDTRLIIIILLRGHVITNTDELSTSLKKETEVKHLKIWNKGMEGILAWVKKMVKKFESQTQEFYKKKWTKIKKKISSKEKLGNSNPTYFKLYMKLGSLYEIVHNNNGAFEEFKQAYNLFNASFRELLRYYSIWEIKAVADVLHGKQAQHYVEEIEVKPLIRLFKQHYATFKASIESLEKQYHYIEYKWRVKQFLRQINYLKQCLLGSDVKTKNKINKELTFLYIVSIESNE